MNQEILGSTFFFQWEVSLIEWLQAHMGAVGTALAGLCTMFGEDLILIAAVGFLYWCYDKEYGKFVGTTLVVGAVLNPMIKNIFMRRRPYMDHAGIKCLRPVDGGAPIEDIAAQGYSFPSGHSMNGAATYGAIAAYRKNRWTMRAAVLLAYLIGLSRFCLGVHYPTDVLAGWTLGALVILLARFLRKKIRDSRLLYLLLLGAGLPGYFYCRSNDYFTTYGMMAGVFAGFLFEERFVHFQNTKKPVPCILRMLGGAAFFLLLNAALKLPFDADLLEGGTLGARLVRSLRYGLLCFGAIGVYPMLFQIGSKLPGQIVNHDGGNC